MPSLSPRRRRLIKNLLSGKFKSKKDVMLASGYSPETARARHTEIIGNYRTEQAIKEVMRERGIDEYSLTDTLGEGLRANKVISALVVAPNGEEMAEASGVTKDFIEVPDHPTRHRFLETALNLRGDFPAEKKEGILTIETHEQRLVRLKEKIGRQL